MNSRLVFNATLSLFTILFVFPSPASAHLTQASGVISGLTHPLLGLDHLLAMVAVGIISTQIGGKTVWLIPGTFVLTMVLGGLFAVVGIGLPFVETAIALSVLILGVGVALSKKSITWVTACVAAFALFHGYAHGQEMPAITSPVSYTLGFVVSTTILHIIGVLIGKFAKKAALSFRILRFSGLIMSITGFYFLLF